MASRKRPRVVDDPSLSGAGGAEGGAGVRADGAEGGGAEEGAGAGGAEGGAGAGGAEGAASERKVMDPAPEGYQEYKENVKFIAMYNHKGGVAKTTTSYALAWLLASKGKKVIIIDVDPQCNLTQLCLARRLEHSGYKPDEYLQGQPRPSTILESVRVVMEAKLEHIRPVHCEKVCRFTDDEGAVTGWVKLVAGSPELTRFEAKLNSAEDNNRDPDANFMGALYHASLMTACVEKADIVLFDLSPSNGAVNRTVMCSADGFLVPCSIDIFSYSAVRALTRHLVDPGVETGLLTRSAVMAARTSGAHYPLPKPAPQFLGFVITRFNKQGTAPSATNPHGLPAAFIQRTQMIVKAFGPDRTDSQRPDGPSLVDSLEAFAERRRTTRIALSAGGGVETSIPPDPDYPSLVPSDDILRTAGCEEKSVAGIGTRFCLMLMADQTSIAPASQGTGIPTPFLHGLMVQKFSKWQIEQGLSTRSTPTKSEEVQSRLSKYWSDDYQPLVNRVLALIGDGAAASRPAAPVFEVPPLRFPNRAHREPFGPVFDTGLGTWLD